MERDASYKQNLSDINKSDCYVPLPYTYRTAQNQQYGEAFEQFAFNEKQTRLIEDFLQHNRICLSSFITAVWSVLLANYAGQYSLPILYSVMPMRKQKNTESMILLPLFVDIQTDDDFVTLSYKVKALLKRLELSSNDFSGEVVQKTEVLGEGSYFNIGITEVKDPYVVLGKEKIASADIAYLNQPQQELNILFSRKQHIIECAIQYNNSLFTKDFIKMLIGHFKVLADKCLEEPLALVLSHSILTRDEYNKIIVSWNQTEREFDRDKTIYQLFEEQVVKTPDAVALEYLEQKLTYSELNYKSNKVSHCIREGYREKMQCDFTADTLVGIFMDRGVEIMPAMLGVLKAGGAYLPIDSKYPDERVRFILKDSKIKIVLTQAKLYQKITRIASDMELSLVICIDEELENGKWSCGNLEPISGKNNLAYVIYTSGSTGKPKGVLIEHEGVTNLANYVIRKLEIGPGSRVMQFASISFDASVYEWIGTLTVGGTLVLLSSDELPPQSDVSDIMHQKNINIAMLTPSVIRVMKKRALPALKTLVAHGEACAPDIVKEWGTDRLFLNAYGPTEVTVACSIGQCFPEKAITIGTAVDNKKIFVLNPFLNPVPVGVSGELWIGGTGLARRYLYRDDLTKERFITKDFMDENGQKNTIRLYKTGDMVRWNPEGELEFVGRNDCQVKIRGYRIELGEIQHHIHQFPGIIECIVEVFENGNNKNLVAYYTAEKIIDLDNLRSHLLSIMPNFMVPAFFISLESIPLNASGKVDRKALPNPGDILFKQEKLTLPENEMEEKLRDIWIEVLKQKHIGTHDNFFAIGGDSILIIQVASKARENGIFITPKQIVENPTIAGLSIVASYHKEAKIRCSTNIYGEFRLTPIQKWFFQQEFLEPHYFNQSQMILLEHCDPVKLAHSVTKLVQCHNELRLKIVSRNKEYFQCYNTDPVCIKINEHKLVDIDKPEEEIADICEKWHKQLDYESGKILNIGLIMGHPDGKDRIFIAVHHLAIDGISWRILLKDLYDLYHGQEIVPPASCFKEWSAALIEYAKFESTLKHLEYWKNVQAQSNHFTLPVDFITAGSTGEQFKELLLTVGESDTNLLLKGCAKAYHTQINDLLITAWVLSLAEWSKNQTVVFNLEGHGREHSVADIDITRTIGWFTALFAACIHIEKNTPLGACIKSVKEQLRKIPDHGISYGALRYCHPDQEVRDSLNNHEPQASFNYLGQFDSMEAEQSDWVTFTRDSAQDNSSSLNHGPNLFELNCSVVYGRLNIFIKYSTLHFKETTIKSFSDIFISNLHSIIEHCSQKKDEEFTPCDFPLVRIEQNHLDEIISAYHSKHYIEKMYPLTSLQAGLLFSYIQNPKLDQYFVQIVWNFHGLLDLERYRKAWKQVMNENEVLRTFFLWDGLDEPCQCVVKEAEIPISFTDLTALSKWEQENKIEEIIEGIRANPFVLSQLPSFCLSLIKRSTDEWTIILSYHHIILDGWSMPLLLNRVHRLYAHPENEVSGYKAEFQFEKYIRWLLSKDKVEASDFWRNVIGEAEHPTDIPVRRSGTRLDIHKFIEKQQEETVAIDDIFTGKIRYFIRERGITLNTLIQFAWNKLLHAYSDDDTTISGMVVSGRAIDLPNVDNYTGMFINTVPAVIRWDNEGSVEKHLVEFHSRIQEMNCHGYIGLNEIKSFSRIKDQAMFYSIIAFENYMNDYQYDFEGFEIEYVREAEKTNYPITIAVCNQRDIITIRVLYDAECFSGSTIKQMLRNLLSIIDFAVEYPTSKISELDLFLRGIDCNVKIKKFKKNKKEIRSVLPNIESAVSLEDKYTAPRNETEKKLMETWKQVLGVKSVNMNDTFYSLGGHSLNVLQIVNILQREGIKVTVNQILQEQTIESIAKLILKNKSTSNEELVDGNSQRELMQLIPEGGFPLSVVQSRFFKRRLVDRNIFNIPYIGLLKENLSLKVIRSALEELIKRHEALSLVFGKTKEGMWYQYYRDVQFEDVFTHINLSQQQDSHDELISDFCSKLQFKFDIETGPLFKVVIFDHYQHEDKQVLLLLFHHLIFDGVSLRIFLEEFKDITQSGEGMEKAIFNKTVSYKEWCMSLRDYAAKNTFYTAMEYWNDILNGGRSLSVDVTSPNWPVHKDMITVVKKILKDKEEVRLLKKVSLELGISNLGLLLTALSSACYEVKKQHDLLLHIMSYQRESFFQGIPVYHTIGFFAGAYPVRIKVEPDESNIFRLDRAMEAVRNMLNQIPKEGLDYLVLKYLIPDMKKNLQLFDDPSHMIFHYLSEETGFVSDDFYKHLPIPFGYTNSPGNPSNYLLNMTAVLKDDQLSLTCYYSGLHYKGETIDRIIDSFTTNLKQILNSSERSV